MDPIANAAVRLHLKPNTFTIASFIAAACAGVLFALGYLLPAIVMVALNAVCDALDGAVARVMGVESPKGDFLDHAVDRYADIFIITGIFVGGAASWQFGVLALTGVLMASYLGTQAQAVGVGRYYGGVLGRADRLVLIVVVGFLAIVFPEGIYGILFLGWLLLIFGVAGHITALQRFAYVWRAMK